jgi:hypothetical protein
VDQSDYTALGFVLYRANRRHPLALQVPLFQHRHQDEEQKYQPKNVKTAIAIHETKPPL